MTAEIARLTEMVEVLGAQAVHQSSTMRSIETRLDLLSVRLDAVLAALLPDTDPLNPIYDPTDHEE